MQRTFEPTLCIAYETNGSVNDMSKPLGVQQMRSQLLGAYHAGLKVETLHCGLVSWRVLQQDTETLAHMKESLSILKNPRLEFSTGSIDYDDDSDHSGTAFGNGTVFLMARASISQTPRLRSMTTSKTYKFGFQPSEIPRPCRLTDIRPRASLALPQDCQNSKRSTPPKTTSSPSAPDTPAPSGPSPPPKPTSSYQKAIWYHPRL